MPTHTPTQTYNFLEHVFDATQSANERVLGTVAIALVIADPINEAIHTRIFRDSRITAENRNDAIRAILPESGFTYYIIGGDLYDG